MDCKELGMVAISNVLTLRCRSFVNKFDSCSDFSSRQSNQSDFFLLMLNFAKNIIKLRPLGQIGLQATKDDSPKRFAIRKDTLRSYIKKS